MSEAQKSVEELAAANGLSVETLNAFRWQMRSVVNFAVQAGMPTNLAVKLAGDEWRCAIDEPVREGFATPEEGLISLLEEEGGCVTIGQACRLFRPQNPVTRQSLSRRIREGGLIAYRTGGDIYMVPVWQFKKTGGILDGLVEVLAAIREKLPGADELSPFTFLLQADPVTGGISPLEALRAGDLASVLAAVDAHSG